MNRSIIPQEIIDRENIEPPCSKVARIDTTTSTSMSLVDISKTDMSIDQSFDSTTHEPKRKSQNIITELTDIDTNILNDNDKNDKQNNINYEDEYKFDEISEIEDIDKYDAIDPIFCTDYVKDIYTFLHQKELAERIDPTYMSRQPNINHRMRGILIDWMIEVSTKFKLTMETSFLAINIVDKYLEKKPVERSKLQLVGLIGIFVASKMEEISAVEVSDLLYISDNAYTFEEIILFEREVLLTINWNLTFPYSIHFLRRFSKAAQSDGYVHTISKFLIELATLSYGMLKYLPSMQAAAAVYLGRRMAGEKVLWSKTAQFYSGYSVDQIMPCVKELNALVLFPNAKLKAVHKKYMSKKFGEVAKLSGIVDLV